ncbi:hypothetical protein [Zavarzinia sp. CC-PAN008]|uniref:hypothetical protein n=1 Tax=Zavarzinia sp. CC-PAN008 TaxID=3243332 RepID=UPI003F743F17
MRKPTRTFSAAETDGLIDALERQIEEATTIAQDAAQDAEAQSYGVYNHFRDKVQEFDTLSILVEERLSNLSAGPDAALQSRFDHAQAGMMGLMIRTSIRFFFVMSSLARLPVGTRDVFMSELRSLWHARKRLEQPHLQVLLDEKAAQDLAKAQDILSEIIARAPSLLDFSGRKA